MNQPDIELDLGIYTSSDISKILNVPYHKVVRYITKYWENLFASKHDVNYSWIIDKSKAINFYTMIELNTFIRILDMGVSIRKLINAHDILVNRFNHPYPLALKSVMNKVKTAGRNIYLKEEGELVVSLDGTNQLAVNFISHFFDKIDFDDDLANRLWPLGKSKSIVVDPKRQFGSPTIEGTRIYPDTIFNLYEKGQSLESIADSFELTPQQVNDAIQFCSQAA